MPPNKIIAGLKGAVAYAKGNRKTATSRTIQVPKLQRRDPTAPSPRRLIHRAAQIADAAWEGAIAGADITPRQFDILSALAQADRPISQTDLVAATDIDRSTLAEMLKRMAAKKLVRVRQNPLDTRVNLVTLTTVGQEKYHRLVFANQLVDAYLEHGLKADDTWRLISSLQTICSYEEQPG